MVKQSMDRNYYASAVARREALRVLVDGTDAGFRPSAPSTANAAQSGSPTATATATAPGIPASVTMALHIPLREGSYFPSLLEPRRRSEALLSVIQQAYPSAGGQAWRESPPVGWTI